MAEFADRFPSSIFAECDSLFRKTEREREREAGSMPGKQRRRLINLILPSVLFLLSFLFFFPTSPLHAEDTLLFGARVLLLFSYQQTRAHVAICNIFYGTLSFRKHPERDPPLESRGIGLPPLPRRFLFQYRGSRW